MTCGAAGPPQMLTNVALLVMAECQPCLPAMGLGYRTLSPGPRTCWAGGLRARGLVRPGPLGGQKTPAGQLDAWGGPSAQSWGPEDPRTDCSGLCHPSPLGPRDRWCMGGGREDTEFPGRTQGSQRNHREGRAPLGSLPPGGVRPCSLHWVSGAGAWPVCLGLPWHPFAHSLLLWALRAEALVPSQYICLSGCAGA